MKTSLTAIRKPGSLQNLVAWKPKPELVKIELDKPMEIKLQKMDALAKLSDAEKALVEAKTVGDFKKIHNISEAARTYAKKAHLDMKAQNRAAEISLRSERGAGELLGRLERGGGGDRRSPKFQKPDAGHLNSEYAKVLEDTETSRQDASRWQRIAAVASSMFEKLIEEGKRVTELTTAGFLNAVKAGKWNPMLSSGEDEWWTPKKYIKAVREVMGGIDLDPASCAEANKTVRAAQFYDRKTNGLDKIWKGRIFLNPPYGQAGPEFIEKFIHDFESTFNEGIILVNARATDADWFQPLFEGILCFTNHRIDFDSPGEKKTSSTHGSCFIYFGPHQKKFSEVFSQFGPIVVLYDNKKS